MKNIVIAIAALLLVCSCATYRNYSRPDEVRIENLFGEDSIFSDTATAVPVPWREFFRDRRLQALIDTGLSNNSDLKIASLRVLQAEATLSAARLAWLPALSLSPQGNLSTYGGGQAVRTYSLGLSADWEIDIAGRTVNGKRGAVAALGQQKSYCQAVSSQLVATIANTYYSLLMLDEQISLSMQSLGTWDEIVRTLEARKRVGEENVAAVEQAKASRLEVENSILSLRQQLKTMETQLCTLIGWTPRAIGRSDLNSQVFPDSLTLGVPLRLLENRPDVRQAEYALQTAFHAVNAARAAFYPSLTLGGTVGWTNNSGAAVVNPGKWLLNALGALTQPLFNRGSNVANLKIARTQQEEALIAFRQKLLDAGAEVNNALTQWQNAQLRLDVSGGRIEALENAVRSTRLLMTHSEGRSYLEVLTAQQSLLAARLTKTQETFDKIQGMIKLYHALGGG